LGLLASRRSGEFVFDVESREWARLDLRRARREKGFRETEAMPRPKKKPVASARPRTLVERQPDLTLKRF
jgi:hypothetical protein